MRREPSSFRDSIVRPRVVRAIITVVSIVCITWVALAYLTAVTLSAENGDNGPLIAMALICAGLLVAALIVWRRGVPLLWILGVGGLAAFIQLLVFFL
jgi:hypothetical protein